MTQVPNGQIQLDQIKQQTDLINAQKAMTDAQKDLATSQTQAAAAQRIGTVTAGPFTGAVNLKDKAGTEEAQLLAARAVRMAAKRIVAAVFHKTTQRSFCLFAVSQAPLFQHLGAYRLRVQLTREALEAIPGTAPTETALHEAPEQPAGANAKKFIGPALASVGLDAAVKLLDFFKTDYDVGGTDTAIDDNALLFAVAGAFRRHHEHGHETSVALPLIYGKRAASKALDQIVAELTPLAKLRAQAAHAMAGLQDQIASLQAQAADPANAGRKTQLLAGADAGKQKLDQLTTAASFYDTFVTSITTPDASGIAPIAAITQELAIDTAASPGKHGRRLSRQEEFADRTRITAALPHGRSDGDVLADPGNGRRSARRRHRADPRRVRPKQGSRRNARAHLDFPSRQ
jgi:hypothetical protein